MDKVFKPEFQLDEELKNVVGKDERADTHYYEVEDNAVRSIAGGKAKYEHTFNPRSQNCVHR